MCTSLLDTLPFPRLWPDGTESGSPSAQPMPFLLSRHAPRLPQDTEDLDHYEMKEEEPAEGKKSEDDGIGKENLAILEKIKKNQRQDYLNVRAFSGRSGQGAGGCGLGGEVGPGTSIWGQTLCSGGLRCV